MQTGGFTFFGSVPPPKVALACDKIRMDGWMVQFNLTFDFTGDRHFTVYIFTYSFGTECPCQSLRNWVERRKYER